MPNTSKKQTVRRRPAQTGRSIAAQRKTGKGQNGSVKTGAGVIAEPVFRLHRLTKGLRPISTFEAAMRNATPSDLLSMVDTEPKQLQAIEDLYHIVKAQPRYKKLKEPNWKPETPPVVVLTWLLRKLGPLAQGDRWTIDTWQDGSKQRYRFVIYKPYSRLDIKEREEHFPLDFLPYLKKRDQALHDIVVDTVALVSKVNKIPLWDNDGDFSTAIEDLAKKEVYGNGPMAIEKELYTTGEAAQYLRLIRKRQRHVFESSIAAMIHRYDAKSERKSLMIWWARLGLRIAYSEQTLSRYSFVPNFHKVPPIGPFRLYKFVWSVQLKEHIVKKAYERIRKAEAIGTYLPVMFSVTKPGQKLKPILLDPFPAKFYHFMREGVAHVLWRYRDYYYGNPPKAAKQSVELLINTIDIEDEIRVTV